MKKRGKGNFLKLNSLKIVISAALFIILRFIPIMPCKVGALVPNTVYSWSVCQANPKELLDLDHWELQGSI